MPAIEPDAVTAHGPVRSCLGCRIRRPVVDLVRLTRRVAGPDGPACVVADGPSDGRGAWLCRATVEACRDAAARHQRFDRAWRTSLRSDDHDDISRALRPLTSTLAAEDAADETSGDSDVAAVGMTTGKG